MTFKAHLGILAAVIVTLGATRAAFSQTIDVVVSDPREAEEQAQAKHPFRLSVAYAHRFEADLDEAGKFSTDTTRIEFASQTPFGRALSWDNMVAYEFNHYKFTNTNGNNSAGGDPWKDVHLLTYIPTLRWNIDKQWSVFGGPVLQVAAESGADFGDGVSGGALVGFLWRRDSNLSVGGAIAAISRIEDTVGLAPIPLVMWRFAEGWTLRSGVPDFGARRGFGLELGWGTQSFEIAGGAQFQRRRFRLDDDDTPGPHDGVGQETSAPVYAKLTFKMGKDAGIDLFAGVSLAGELKVEDDNGHAESLRQVGIDPKQDFDPAPVIGARANFVF